MLPPVENRDGTFPVNPENGEIGWSPSSLVIKSAYKTDWENLYELRHLIPNFFCGPRFGHHDYIFFKNKMSTPFPQESVKVYYAKESSAGIVPDRMKVSDKGGIKTLSHIVPVYQVGPSTVDSRRKIIISTLEQQEEYLRGYSQTTGRIKSDRYSLRVLQEDTQHVFDILLDRDERIGTGNPNEAVRPPIQIKIKYRGDLTPSNKVESKIENPADPDIVKSIIPATLRLFENVETEVKKINSSARFWDGNIQPRQTQMEEGIIFTGVPRIPVSSGKTG